MGMMLKGYKDGAWYYQMVTDFRDLMTFSAMVDWYEYIGT